MGTRTTKRPLAQNRRRQPLRIDTVDIWLRADFPHGDTWNAAVIEFSDGSTLPIHVTKSADRQSFPFPPRQVSWLKIHQLQPYESNAWRAISEVEAWGRRPEDNHSGAAPPAPAGIQ